MNSRVLSLSGILALASVALLPVALGAQSTAKPAAKAPSGDSASKWDIFAGYSYLAPISTRIPTATRGTPGSMYGQINFGSILSLSRYFNHHLGLQIEGSEHIQSENWPLGSNNSIANSNDNFAGGSAGLIYRFPMGHFTPFVHALAGGELVGSVWQTDTWGLSATVGGGLDYNTPWFNHRLAFRLAQGDFQYFDVNSNNIAAYRISSGMVYKLGELAPPPPVLLACEASNPSVFPGETVTILAKADNLDPKRDAVYRWEGGKPIGKGTSATFDTAALAPGYYTVKGLVQQGVKAGQSAECSAGFTVKAFEPPTVACTVAPSIIKPGTAAAIHAAAVSPQGRPLNYSYKASAGTIQNMGADAAFESAGAPTGAVGISCIVSDDKGHSATANATLTIVAPYIAPAPRTRSLCSVGFKKDKKRPTRVDNEAKACLDDVALSLRKQPDAKVVVVGALTAEEKTLQQRLQTARKRDGVAVDAAAERAVNTKDYLVTEKGIDAARIVVATSVDNDQKVEDYLVPAGADFSADVHGTRPVNEAQVKPQPRKPLPVKKHRRKTVQ